MGSLDGPVLAARDPTGDQILRLIADPFSGQLANQSLVASVGISLGFTFLIAILFSLVRPLNTAIYQPKLKYAEGKSAPPPLGKSVWAWIPAVVKTNEDLLVEQVGIDAALFIRFTKMWRNIFLIFTILGCCIFIPASVLGGKQLYSNWEVSSFMKMTPQFMFGRIFWAYVCMAYVFNIIICIFLFINYKAVVRLRRRFYQTEEYQRSLHSRTLMVRDIVPKNRTDEALLSMMLRRKVVEDVPRAVIARNVKDLPDLIEEREEAVRRLEKYLAKYLKNPNNLPPHRPSYKPSRKERKRYGSAPVDAIDHFTAKIQHLEREIKMVRSSVNARDAMSYGFVSYPTIEGAHYTAYTQRNKHPNGTTIKLAPRPGDLIWKNLGLSPAARRWQKFMNNVWVVILTLVWTVPNALIAIFLTNFNNLASVWPAFAGNLHRNPKTWAVIQGVLSPALTSLFYFFLPSIFRRLSIRAGDVAKTSRELHVTHKLYSFFVFNNLIIFSLFSTVWKWAASIIMAQKGNDHDLYTALKTYRLTSHIMIGLCNMSPFWIFWLLQRNLGAAVDLSQIAHLAWVSAVRRFTSPTPRELIELTAPAPFDYASYYNYFLFYSTVAICFAPLQPLVLPVTAFYFGLDCYLKKYLLLYVFITKTESGGQFWRVLFNRVLFAAFLGDVVVGVIVAANGYDKAMLYALVPLPIGLILFKWYCATQFDHQTHFYTTVPPGQVTTTEMGLPSKMDVASASRVMSKFGHPALYKKLITPMVHANARHVLSRVYNGRTSIHADDGDDLRLGGYTEAYNMGPLPRSHGSPSDDKSSAHWDRTSGDTKDVATGNGAMSRFQFVEEADIEQERFAHDPEFRQSFVGDADSIASVSRSGSPAPGQQQQQHPASHHRPPFAPPVVPDDQFTPPPGYTSRPGGATPPAPYRDYDLSSSHVDSHHHHHQRQHYDFPAPSGLDVQPLPRHQPFQVPSPNRGHRLSLIGRPQTSESSQNLLLDQDRAESPDHGSTRWRYR